MFFVYFCVSFIFYLYILKFVKFKQGLRTKTMFWPNIMCNAQKNKKFSQNLER